MAEPVLNNVVEFTVSELSAALKRTVEDAYGYVRVRGEVSGFKGPHSSGHCYFALKDENARIEAVIWRATYSRMTAGRGEGCVDLPQCYTREPKRERMNFRQRKCFWHHRSQPIEIALWPRDLRAGKHRAVGHFDGAAVAHRARSMRCAEQLVSYRRVNCGDQRTAVLRQRNGNGPVCASGDIGTRSIDRVNDPRKRPVVVDRLIMRFF